MGREPVATADSSGNTGSGNAGSDSTVNRDDPFASALPSTREAAERQHFATSPSTRELLTASSFRFAFNPGDSLTQGDSLADGSSWAVWGEAAFTSFDGAEAELSLDGEVLTGLAALDWQREPWLLGMGFSRSQGDGTFAAPATANEAGIKGTVRSSLTTLYPYLRYRPRPGLEFRGVAGYGYGSMTLKANLQDPVSSIHANPDIWQTMVSLGVRSAVLPAAATGGLALDVTADALHTRTAAETAGSLGEAVSASTTRLRLGMEGSRKWQFADGTSVVPTITTALRYDAGAAETGLGLELGVGLAYANPPQGIVLSTNLRGLLGARNGEDGAVLREWGGSASFRYDRGDDKLGFTITMAPSWGVADSGSNRFWSDHALRLSTSNDVASSGAARLDGEIGYGFALFSSRLIITPYARLTLTAGERNWKVGSRLERNAPLGFVLAVEQQGSNSRTTDHNAWLGLMGSW